MGIHLSFTAVAGWEGRRLLAQAWCTLAWVVSCSKTALCVVV